MVPSRPASVIQGAPFGWVQRGLAFAGLLLLALWSGMFLESRAFQSGASAELEAALLEHEGSPAVAPNFAAMVGALPLRPLLATKGGGVLGRIEIPRLGISAIVAEGVDFQTLKHAVGHLPSTARPGSRGNCALAGHRDTFFRGLGGVRVNDVIRVVTSERTLSYAVEWTRVVEPTRVDVLDPTPSQSLTLITCYPFAFVGHAPKRFIVRAILRDETGAIPPG